MIDYKALAERLEGFAAGQDHLADCAFSVEGATVYRRNAADLRTVVSLLEGMAANPDDLMRLTPEAEAYERAARVCEPNEPRPCDCTSCDCGNYGDAQRVAQWDEATARAAEIRSLIQRNPERQPVSEPTEAQIEYEILCNGEWVAGASGEGAEAEILHYLTQYEQDGPCEVYAVTRRLVDRAALAAKEQPT